MCHRMLRPASLSPSKAVREQARKIVSAGETAAYGIDRRTIATLNETRTAFLDLDTPKEVAEPAVVGRALDLEAVA